MNLIGLNKLCKDFYLSTFSKFSPALGIYFGKHLYIFIFYSISSSGINTFPQIDVHTLYVYQNFWFGFDFVYVSLCNHCFKEDEREHLERESSSRFEFYVGGGGG